MRAIILPTVAALALACVALNSSTRTADAEPATPPAASTAAPAQDDGPARGHEFMRWRHAGFWLHRRIEHARMWGLFYHVDDKHLTPDDVQKIAEALLLRHGIAGK